MKNYEVSPAWCLEVYGDDTVTHTWVPTDDEDMADGWVVCAGDEVHTLDCNHAFVNKEDAVSYAKELADNKK